MEEEFKSSMRTKTAVPILPYNAYVSTLLAQEAHQVNHEGVAGTLLRMRRKAWVVKGRRLAKKSVDCCVTCRKARAKQCQQIMGDLPPERSEPAAPFEFKTLDLFGPYVVKNEVKKRTGLKVWGLSSVVWHQELSILILSVINQQKDFCWHTKDLQL